MKIFQNPVLKVVGMLALIFVLALACAKSPKAPDTNSEPNTFVTTYGINTLPDSATVFSVTVYWRASDPDGWPEYYRYWVDDGPVTETFETSATIKLDFATPANIYTFNVEARDNQGLWDTSPANVDIRMSDSRRGAIFSPNTVAGTVPPDGSLTSRGVFFVFNGNDIDGSVESFQWAADDTTTWNTLTPTVKLEHQSILELRLTDADLSYGPHIVFVRAVDNQANVDASPVSVSFNAVVGFAPELALSVSDGQKFVVPFTTPVMDNLTINFSAAVDFYYSAIRDYYVITSGGVNDTTMESSITLTDVAGGDYWIKVVANDIGGNSTVDSTNYSVVVLAAHQGILGVNGDDWASYGQEAINLWNRKVPFGNFTHWKWWDLFPVPPSGGRPYADSVLGTGSVPTWMFDTTFFAAIAWMGNEFSGDDAFWFERQTEIMNYLNNGGNLVLAARFGSDFYFDELTAFAGVDAGGWLSGASPNPLTADVDSVTNITPLSGQSRAVLATVTGSTTTTLWIDPAHAGYAAGFIAEPAGKGKFVYIAGRNYRWNSTELRDNLDVIYRYYFGMRNQY